MQADRWKEIQELYEAAIALPPEKRAEFLAQACPADAGLRGEVQALLAQPANSFLESAPLSAIKTLSPGVKLGNFEIVELIGRGGMGEVYRALDTRLKREVAIKVSLERFSDRLEREARAVAALNHPNICTLYDIGSNYLVMELVEGETLAARLKRGALSIEQTIEYGRQIAEALAAAHAKGIVHRDLKPGNVMLTKSGVKVLDFGLAKSAGDDTLTLTHVVVGTPAYMAPEQLGDGEVDSRADLFALGLVLYEMAAGKRAFPGKSLGPMLAAGAISAAPRLSVERAGTPARLDALVAELLAKDLAQRCQSAAGVAAELSAQADSLTRPAVSVFGALVRPAVMVPIVLAVLLAILGGIWLYLRSEKRQWAAEEAIPEIDRLIAQTKPLAAFQVLMKAEQYLPGDPRLSAVARRFTTFTSVKTLTAGAKVEIQDYLAPNGPWYSLGLTPVAHARIPDGYFRWRISRPGAGEFVTAPATDKSMEFPFPIPADAEAGMVPVPGGPWGDLIGFVGWVFYQLPAFDMDRFEVTNREYQKFVDQGGYQKREYWREKFIRDGKELTWEQAVDLFRDSTGRPGPATWAGGHSPQGQADYPVSGVSWYEASAYAAFVGKSLPAVGEWYRAAPNDLSPYTIHQSHFGGSGPIPVGASQAVGPYGTYDMVGNVREWCLNAVDGDMRFTLGGAWVSQTYQAYEPEAFPPLDRSPFNGFRCVRNRGPLTAAAAAPVVRRIRDFSKVRPASDELFQAYRALYAYDKLPLAATVEEVTEDTPDWTKRKITIDAGYEGQRLPMFLFLPKKVHPPYQTVVFFPSARVNLMENSQKLGDMEFIDYVIQSGRAVLYPIYRETYERHPPGAAFPGEVGDRELTIQESKEVRRAVDYLETRPDIVDMNRLAYLGVSQGTAYGIIFTALEERFQAVIFLDGGFFLNPAVAGRDQADFAPRLKKPVLMVNGRYDFTFPPDQSQMPMFRMIGTAPADKFRIVLETPHNVSQSKGELSKEVLWFLDKYFGRVN